MARILVIDDEANLRDFLEIVLEEEGYDVVTVASAGEARERLSERWDLAICDLKLPDGSGLDVIEAARKRDLDLPFIIITAHTTPAHAMESLRAGAAEYLSKPFDVNELKIIVAKIIARRLGPPERSTVQQEPGMIADSAAMRSLLALVPRIAATPSTVLLTGESGTGKELFARAIHRSSDRSNGEFLTINCGAVPEGLLESELFGHTRGSFTGAIRDHVGLFVAATDGTLFLDEIGELPLTMQVKLLRALQERRVRPVGTSHEIESNARIIAATNQNLTRSVAEGRFREDLFYRLNVLHLHLPPLRHRPADIPPLARFFVERSCDRLGFESKRLTSDAIRILEAYDWPGNVRQLENVIERTVALEISEILSSGSLPSQLTQGNRSESKHSLSLPEEGIDLEEYLSEIRHRFMVQALERTNGHQKKAAKLLRSTYRSFRYHADKLKLIGQDEDTPS